MASRTRARRTSEFLTAIVVLGLVAAAVMLVGEAPDETIRGSPFVADGDTLIVDGARIRLMGIDAPEFEQTCRSGAALVACGRFSRDLLRGLVANRPVACSVEGRDRFGRPLATCDAGSAELNGAMVRDGWAVSYGDYEIEEALARSRGSGLWAYSFDRPQEWRRKQQMPEGEGRPAGNAAAVANFLRALPETVKGWLGSGGEAGN
jgi:endonuclease YncB( thermonuclease family)